MKSYRIGWDIGSTTAKMVVLDAGNGDLVLGLYQRHQTRVRECLDDFLRQLEGRLGDIRFSACMTGSVGMGMAESLSLPFIQEVVAASCYLRSHHPDVSTLIDIGGEDAKMIFLHQGRPTDLRMNGNCAGGTGAFIDQMAVLLNVSPAELGALAEQSTRLYPIASRCGVFCKTDIQNLIARNVPAEDIAASILHAVSVQTIITLAHGHTIEAPILLCGGPLTFIPALRRAFADYLHLPEEAFLLPEKAHLIPAWGAALSAGSATLTLSSLRALLQQAAPTGGGAAASSQPAPLFTHQEDYDRWKQRLAAHKIRRAPLIPGMTQAVLGIDSGSTTTKIVLLNREGKLLCSHYRDNNGNPVQAVRDGLEDILEQCRAHDTTLQIVASCSTGYGEELIRAAFRLDSGIVETMAHYMAAKHISDQVSFILDIGGQDMKAIFVKDGVIHRLEVNEACSSGCGSFISTFARTLNCTVDAFAQAACLAPAPCDLGTRCTVFMNSRVKQVLREGASLDNIAAGLSYSVIRNCLYKVLRLKDTASLGGHIIVQGGAMRNDSIVRCLELLTGKQVYRSDCPELGGALGCALYALRLAKESPTLLQDMLAGAEYRTGQLLCHGCENQCSVTRYRFQNKNSYFSGNRCEKIFNNQGLREERGPNAYERKRALLFERQADLPAPLLTVGLPRCLNMYEECPFWHTLFTACNIRVHLSSPSSFARYEQSAGKVMSDNICFPAKLVHSHIDELLRQQVDRIFMPFVLHEKSDKQMQNSYNCPIVSGYSQVIRSVQAGDIPIDTPAISFRDAAALRRQCREYLLPLGVNPRTFRTAFTQAWEAQEAFEQELTHHNEQLLAQARQKGQLSILLAGRPYHADPLIQHKVSEMIASLGVCVLTDDIVRGKDVPLPPGVHYLSQWAFSNRVLKAARWASLQENDVQYVQLTSFGCGPDAFVTDENQALLSRRGKNLTLLKIDDVQNIGSLKLRIRSLVESLRIGAAGRPEESDLARASHSSDTANLRKKKILVPFFTPFLSPLMSALLARAGYEAETLPMSDSRSAAWGLQFANNEVCYPATLIVGDIVKALRSGRYDPEQTCVAITQTGGQCRASNYLTLIQKALQENGFHRTPVLSVSFGHELRGGAPALPLNWLKLLPLALSAILYSDAIARFYHAAVIRENHPGAADALREKYLEKGRALLRHESPGTLYPALAQAAADFNAICRRESRPRVGLVGEIFLKFHPFAQKHVTDWLISQRIEVVYPALIDFFLQSFVNQQENKKSHLRKNLLPNFLLQWIYRNVRRQIDKANAAASAFDYFIPFDDIFEKAARAQEAISLHVQFGEGWLIAGEMSTLASQGIHHIISLQPFGCIANHIASRGIENRIRALYPGTNILSLDFDSSVSEVNIINRLLLFIHDMAEPTESAADPNQAAS